LKEVYIMTIYIKDPAADAAIRKLARLKGTTLTEAIKSAVEQALEAERRSTLKETLAAIHKEVESWPKTGLEADKAFYDELSGDA
jgi:antitoxin VapB